MDEQEQGQLPAVDISQARQLLLKARESLDQGRYISAGNYAKMARKVGLKSIEEYQQAVEKLDQTRDIIEKSSMKGIDTARASDFYNQAYQALDQGLYGNVNEMCRLAFIACQPDPEPGFDFTMKTRLYRQDEQDGSISYFYEISLENNTNILMEGVTISVPDSISSLFTPDETSRYFSLTPFEKKGTVFYLKPKDRLDGLNEVLVGRDVEFRTTLDNDGTNPRYIVEIVNLIGDTIKAISIEPPAFIGYYPEPADIMLEDIPSQETGVAEFKLIPGVVGKVPGSRKERKSFPEKGAVEKPSEEEFTQSDSGETKEWDVEQAAEELSRISNEMEKMSSNIFWNEETPENEPESQPPEPTTNGDENSKQTDTLMFTPLPPDPETMNNGMDTLVTSQTPESDTDQNQEEGNDGKDEWSLSWKKFESFREELDSRMNDDESDTKDDDDTSDIE